jgi:hypothetical protein
LGSLPGFKVHVVCGKCGRADQTSIQAAYYLAPYGVHGLFVDCRCGQRATTTEIIRSDGLSEGLHAWLARKTKGRPRIGDIGKTLEATKPWLKLGMSRRTWYRRRKVIHPSRPSHDQA